MTPTSTMVEFVDQMISRVSWQTTAKDIARFTSETQGSLLISGSCDHGNKNKANIWKFLSSPSGTFEQLPMIEAASVEVDTDVTQALLVGKVAFVSLANGTVLLYEYSDHGIHNTLSLISETPNLHTGYHCNDMLFCSPTNSVITCGSDGNINCFCIERHQTTTSYRIANTAINCIDMVSQNEIICGTLTGHLKHFDLRAKKCIKSLASQKQSSALSIKRNPNVLHYVTCGNSDGLLSLFDLRNDQTSMAQIAAHDAAISQIRYKPGESNILFSSSFDGQLLRWNFNSEFVTDQKPKKVEYIASRGDCLPINSFDVNVNGDMIYACDNEALYYLKIDESIE